MAFFVFITAPSAAALSAGGIGARPAHPDDGITYSDSWFIYQLDLGESRQDSLIVFNTTEEVQTIKLYPVDSVPSSQGDFALAAEVDPKKGVGAWVTLAQTLLTLPPHSQEEVPFTISIPANADVGEHSGGIIIQKAETVTDVASGTGSEIEGGAAIVTRVGIRIYQTVPGDIIRELSLRDFNIKRIAHDAARADYEATVTVANNSNVSLTAHTDLVIGGWGKVSYGDIEDLSIKSLREFFSGAAPFPVRFFSGQTLSKEWQLLRGQEVATNWQWPEPEFGHFTFMVRVTYDGTDGPVTITTARKDIWVIPWMELGVLVLPLAALIILIISVKLSRRGKGWVSYTVRTGDQLALIAEQAGVAWQRLAKVNRLKSPLVLPGQKILVPRSFSAAASAAAPVIRKSTVRSRAARTDTVSKARSSKRLRKGKNL